jgi:putative restriction endonuclease
VTVLLGYDPAHELFAGFDFQRHRSFSSKSPSVQVDINVVERADNEGLSFQRKSNDEIALGVRPDQLLNYSVNSLGLHRFGAESEMLPIFSKAAEGTVPQGISKLSVDRKRLVQAVSRLSRSANFARNVLSAYGHRCAATGLQLRIIEAAHILPVGAPGSTDEVGNGIALSPTFHRAYDNGLIYIDEKHRLRLNLPVIRRLKRLKLANGLDELRRGLGKLHLPKENHAKPSPLFIREANKFRKIGKAIA